METTFRRLSKRHRKELAGYVAPGIFLFRAALFIVAIGSAGWLMRAVHLRWIRPTVDSDVVWVLPTVTLAVALYLHSGRWTGGRRLRAAIRRDIARGDVAVHRISALDAVEVEPGGDEGPSYFILTEEGSTLFLSGQYLETFTRKGFPWKAFAIVEAPESKIFLRIESLGERLTPSAVHSSALWQEMEKFTRPKGNYGIVDVDFAALKARRPAPPRL
jgi:hypothetical protein